MKQASKKLIEDILAYVSTYGDINIERLKRDLNSVLFMESAPPSKRFSMYVYCRKSSLTLYHKGVFHDPKEKMAVVTDGRVVCYSKNYFMDAYEGDIVDDKYAVIKCRFPNWRYVIHIIDQYRCKSHFKVLDFDAIDNAYRKSKVWADLNLKHIRSSSEKESKMLFNIDGNYFTIEYIRKVSLALREFNVDGINVCDDPSSGQSAFYLDDDNGIVVMPVFPEKYEEKKGFYVVKL